MPDLSYAEATAAAPPRVLLGPAPCQGCGAWVEWAGVAWLNAGTEGEHDCAPFLIGMAEAVGAEVVAEWTRPTMAPYRMAHPATPRWQAVLLTVAVLVIAAALGLVAGRVLGALL